MTTIRDLIESSAALAPEATLGEAHARFMLSPNLPALALVEAGRPVGAVHRFRFYDQFAAGAAPAHEPAAALAEAALTAEADLSLEELSAFLERHDAPALAGFVAVEDGAFLGVGAVGAAHRAAAQSARRRAQRLARLTALLEDARREAEAADLAKSRFIADMSHEMRTQLDAIHGYAELISDEYGAGNPELRQDARNIVLAGRTLLDFANQILDFARLESGSVDFDPEPIDLDHWLCDALDVVRPLAGKNGNELAVEAEAPLGEAHADADRLRQCLVNVAGNACKFTANGRVSILARVETHACGRRLLLSVRDTGVGMTPAQLANLFKPFERSDPRIARAYGGHGLGLSITKRLLELMGGTISAASAPGEGARFDIAVPIDAVAAPARQPVAAVLE